MWLSLGGMMMKLLVTSSSLGLSCINPVWQFLPADLSSGDWFLSALLSNYILSLCLCPPPPSLWPPSPSWMSGEVFLFFIFWGGGQRWGLIKNLSGFRVRLIDGGLFLFIWSDSEWVDEWSERMTPHIHAHTFSFSCGNKALILFCCWRLIGCPWLRWRWAGRHHLKDVMAD